jgi:hypothetical protein
MITGADAGVSISIGAGAGVSMIIGAGAGVSMIVGAGAGALSKLLCDEGGRCGGQLGRGDRAAGVTELAAVQGGHAAGGPVPPRAALPLPLQ